ncbi:MAG TPA: hypothetical protein PK636_05235 [bacterium]|nr:hypothetical protein [bacterium]
MEKTDKILKDYAVSTDLITGFPGESDEDFNATLKAVKEIKFDEAFMFSYSPREGTPAYEMKEFLTAKETGDWSEFSFSSEDAVIFVGCTWPGGRNTHVYRGSGGWPGEDPVFDDRFFHEINRMEAKDAGPAYTNMKISFSD